MYCYLSSSQKQHGYLIISIACNSYYHILCIFSQIQLSITLFVVKTETREITTDVSYIKDIITDPTCVVQFANSYLEINNILRLNFLIMICQKLVMTMYEILIFSNNYPFSN